MPRGTGRGLERAHRHPPGAGGRHQRELLAQRGEVAFALRVIAAFAAEPNAGTVGIDGKMYDIPHLKAAHKTLAFVNPGHEA